MQRATLASAAMQGQLGGAVSFGAGVDVGMDLEQFIAENGIDEQAAALLRLEPPQVIQAVIERGSLAETNNPSAAVMGRVKAAKKGVAGGVPVAAVQMGQPMAAMQPGELEDFCIQYQLDERATRALQSEDPIVQRAVIDRGDFAGCTNVSAVVLGRIKSARQSAGLPATIGINMVAQGQGGVEPGEVEEFCVLHQLDEAASKALQEEDPAVQRAVIDRGDISGCKNPSAVVLSRIKAAKQHYGSTGMGMTQTIGLNMPAPLPHPSMFAAGGGMPGTAPGGGFAPGLSAGAMGAAHQDFAAMLGDAQGFAAAFGQFGGLSGFGAMGGGGGMGGANRDNPY
eukprot:gnl/TRDRNA2_/TRDRNA2_172768_c1_seq9.p1 gnl/TRDRNA2_/TRDRNA2_172768_c1~~gnl/TRDRNA2_/TRDRNA2_172768_c1_seq9.p1  ORF type:complete len:340 (-),score=62.75 gnl/TRDRNA2_/TRDRNA2_172768_c1_seq9:58-1077(-)